MTEIESAGLANKVVVVIGSDFGRTPNYNPANGKDHWSITSMMFMGPGIRGGRVIGATDPRHRALKVNPQTLAVEENGVVLKPSHVHASLRRLARIDASDNARRFPVAGGDVDLFG